MAENQKTMGRLILFIVLVVSSRFLITLGPGWTNFSPLGAFALYAGYHYSWRGWIATAIAVIASNMLINNVLYTEYYNGFSWGIDHNLVIFIVISMMGISQYKNTITLHALSAVLFFVMSNLMVWGGNMYTHDLQGMIKCYTFALPFFPNTLISQFVFGTILFTLNKYTMNDLTTLQKDRIIK